MSNLQVIENKMSYILKHIAVAKSYQRHDLKEIEQDMKLRGAIERELYVISQAVIDLAEALIAYKKFRKPTTMREAIDILGEEHVLPASFIGEFDGIVGFRNALAHDYEDLKLEVVYDVLQNKLTFVETFLQYIREYV